MVLKLQNCSFINLVQVVARRIYEAHSCVQILEWQCVVLLEHLHRSEVSIAQGKGLLECFQKVLSSQKWSTNSGTYALYLSCLPPKPMSYSFTKSICSNPFCVSCKDLVHNTQFAALYWLACFAPSISFRLCPRGMAPSQRSHSACCLFLGGKHV